MSVQKAIKCVGFELSDELNAYALRIVKELKMVSPSQSFVMLNLRMIRPDTYEGSVDIKSFQRNFFGSISAASPGEVLDSLFDKLRKQIDEWKEVRFDSDSDQQIAKTKQHTSDNQFI